MALFHCEPCGIKKEVPNSFVGKPVRCPSCKRAITILDQPFDPAVTNDIQDEGHHLHLPTENTSAAKENATHPLAAVLPSALPSATPHPPTATLEISERPSPRKRPLMHGGMLPNLTAGLEGGILLIFFCITFAILIHGAAPMLGSLPFVLGMALTSATFFCIIVSLLSRLPLMAAGPETITCAFLFLFAGFVHSNTDGMTPDQARATLLAGLILTSLLTGMATRLAAKFDAGRILRFIPQPVIGGLLAMVGVVLIQGALQISTLDPFCIKALLPDLGIEQCLKWIPATAMGLLFTLLLYRSKNALLHISLIALGIGVGHALYWYWDVAIPAAQNLNLLLAPAQPALPWNVLTKDLITNVQWHVLLNGLPYMVGAMILLILSLAEKIYTLEIILEDEVDLNDLLKSLSLANMCSALAGGLPGSVSISRCIGSGAVQNRGPIAGVIAGVICGSALFWVGPLIGYIPRFIPAGLLVFFGMSLLRKWLVDTKREFTRGDDYSLLVIIFLIALTFGILAGMAAGFLLSILVLANRYSKITVIKHLLPGSKHRSRVDRAAEQLAILKSQGDEILMMRLQGFIFLGSTTPIISAIHKRIQDGNQPPLAYLILDFSRVSGLAAQVAISFTQLKQLAHKNNFCLIFTNVPFEVEQQLESAGYALTDPDGTSLSFVDMDYALEWCEDRILASAGVDKLQARSLEAMLAPIFPEPDKLHRLVPYLEQMHFNNKEYVFLQGDTADAMYFIESGMITIQLELGGKKTTRLKKMGPGTVFGEMGIYTHAPRSASAVAEGKCCLYRLSQATLDSMQVQDPQLISALHRFMVNLLSQRVNDANFRVIDLLQ